MASKQIKRLLQRYLTGKSNAKERARVERWYKRLQEEESEDINQQQEERLKEEIWQKLQSKMDVPELGKIRSFSNKWWQIAAAVFLVTGLGLLFHMGGKQSQIERQMTSIVTQAGERRVVVLKDSSVLTVKGGSSIRIGWDLANTRMVEIIDGEIFFEIKQNPTQPFVVKSGPLQTRVLGTSFNIRAYEELSEFAISVTSGKVSVSPAGMQREVLAKNRQLIYDKEKQQVTLTTNEAAENSWGSDLFVLDNAPFEEVALLLSKNYGLQIKTEDTRLKTKRFTATLKNTVPAAEVLQVLAAIHKLKTKKRGDYIEIYK